MRIKLRSSSRLTDLFRVTGLSIVITSISVLLGMYLFERQGCVTDFFEENSICKPCRDFVNPFCAQCEDRTACNECDRGFYPFDRQCIDCKIKDNLCLACDSSGCLECIDGFFHSKGKCTSCKLIEGCVEGACTSQTGCTECTSGYYLDDGQCKSCSSVM